MRDPIAGEDLVHLHDYERIYGVPGLYEHIVQRLLRCRSPQIATDGLAQALERLELDPGQIVLLDLGAGTGIVGELANGLGVRTVIGVDALEAARAACLRDRPRVYRDYLVGDLAAPRPELLERLRSPSAHGARIRRRLRRRPCTTRGASQRPCTASSRRSRRVHNRRAVDANGRPRRLPSPRVSADHVRRATAPAQVALPASPVDDGKPDPLRTHRRCERQRRASCSRPLIQGRCRGDQRTANRRMLAEPTAMQYTANGRRVRVRK